MSNSKGPGRSLTLPSFYKSKASLSPKDSLLPGQSYFPPYARSSPSHPVTGSSPRCAPEHPEELFLKLTCPSTFWYWGRRSKATAYVFWKWLPTQLIHSTWLKIHWAEGIAVSLDGEREQRLILGQNIWFCIRWGKNFQV